MLKLCGFPVSNYYNKVKMALLEKGVPFEEELVYPLSEQALARSPLGKVPFIEDEGRTLAESQAIAEYLEDIYPSTPLYPRDPYQRAKCRELIYLLETYVELMARRLYPQVFFNRPVPEATRDEVAKLLGKSTRGFARLARFDPFVAGPEFTLADCAAFNHLAVIGTATSAVYGRDALTDIPQIGPYLAQIGERPSAKKVSADREAGMASFRALLQKVAAR